jgi:hypothetical protein
MTLYVVVHHQRDANQPWQNGWGDDNLLQAIQTTKQIGQLCREAQQAKEPVFVHRCGWGEFSPTICCSAFVSQVGEIDKGTDLVVFERQSILGAKPPKTPVLGQNFYMANSVGPVEREIATAN